MPLNAVKKTQLGPGSTQRESPWEGWRGDGMRPACRSSTGRRGESDAALRGRHRTACLEAATQPRDGCAAGMRNGRGAWHTPTRACTVLDTVVSEGPMRGVRFNLCECVPASETVSREQRLDPFDRLTQREGVCPTGETVRRARLNPFDLTPGRLFGERRLDPKQPVPDSGDGNPPGFSARNAGKARNCVNYPPNSRANGRAKALLQASRT